MNFIFSILPKAGIAKLVTAFKAEPFPISGKRLKTTLQVGSIRYRKCASIMIVKKGVYVEVKYVFRAYPTIFIPFASIKEIKQATLYGLKARQFIFKDPGTPSIVFYETDLLEFNFDGIEMGNPSHL